MNRHVGEELGGGGGQALGRLLLAGHGAGLPAHLLGGGGGTGATQAAARLILTASAEMAGPSGPAPRRKSPSGTGQTWRGRPPPRLRTACVKPWPTGRPGSRSGCLLPCCPFEVSSRKRLRLPWWAPRLRMARQGQDGARRPPAIPFRYISRPDRGREPWFCRSRPADAHIPGQNGRHAGLRFPDESPGTRFREDRRRHLRPLGAVSCSLGPTLRLSELIQGAIRH